MLHLRGSVALAALAEGEDPRRWLRIALDAARTLEKGRPWIGPPLAALLRAGIASVEGSPGRAIALLERAERELEGGEMVGSAAAARRRRGRILGGDEGRELVERADSWMRSHGVRDPGRMTAALVPGLRDPPS